MGLLLAAMALGAAAGTAADADHGPLATGPAFSPPSCPQPSTGDEIIVCAKAPEESPYRLRNVPGPTNAGRFSAKLGNVGVDGGGPKESVGVKVSIAF